MRTKSIQEITMSLPRMIGMPIAVYWVEEPVTQHIPRSTEDRIRLKKDMEFLIDTKDSHGTLRGYKIVVKVGFRFEGSVPSWAWSVSRITPTEPAALPGWCLHDFCYILVKLSLMTKEQADELLRLCLKDRFNAAQVKAVGFGVWAGGAPHCEPPATTNDILDIQHANAIVERV